MHYQILRFQRPEIYSRGRKTYYLVNEAITIKGQITEFPLPYKIGIQERSGKGVDDKLTGMLTYVDANEKPYLLVLSAACSGRPTSFCLAHWLRCPCSSTDLPRDNLPRVKHGIGRLLACLSCKETAFYLLVAS
jgi:hypothetical protein